MSSEIVMPQLGETVAEGKILTWFKAVGDPVKPGDRLFEVESDKVTVEVEAVAGGVLTEIRVKDGSTVRVGTLVGIIGAAGTAPSKSQAVPIRAANTAHPKSSPFEEVHTAVGDFGPAKTANGLRISPLARRLVAEHGLDLETMSRQAFADNKTRIARDDVLAALKQPQAAMPVPAQLAPLARLTVAAPGDVMALNTIRQRTGDRLAENWRTIPHVFQATDIDFTRVDAVRGKHKGSFQAATGFGLTFLPFIARALCVALKDFPQVNARLDGKSLVLSREIGLGFAVDLAHNGLVLPVVRDADDLTVGGLAKAIGRLIERARAGRLASDDLAGGTYSISNNGSFGTLFTTPIINAPQVAILSVDAIRKRPAIVETAEGDFITSRLIGTVGQSFDHRAFDGAYSAAFLARLKDIIETRNWDDDLASERQA